MCVKVVLMMELLYEEKTLTYEEEVMRFFFWRILQNVYSFIYFIYSQKKISLTKYLHAILLLLCLLLLNILSGKEPSFIVENRVGAALTVSAFLFRVWIDQLDALDRRERQGRTHAR